MRPTPYVASLRIYEPLSAFNPVDRLRWQNLNSDEDTKRTEQSLALRRIVFPESPTTRPDGAHVLDRDGIRYVCPWATATRTWVALADFKTSLPNSVTQFFMPQSLEDVLTAGADLVEDKVPHILTETWIVPPRWFSLFITDDVVRGVDEDGPFTYLRTEISHARARCQLARSTVLAAFGPGFVEQELGELNDWLELFHPESLVELDYGGLAGYLDQVLRDLGEDGIYSDTSVEDILLSLAGLSSGDSQMAGRGYERLVTRWRAVQAFESRS